MNDYIMDAQVKKADLYKFEYLPDGTLVYTPVRI
jgi:hypothetical protein